MSSQRQKNRKTKVRVAKHDVLREQMLWILLFLTGGMLIGSQITLGKLLLMSP